MKKGTPSSNSNTTKNDGASGGGGGGSSKGKKGKKGKKGSASATPALRDCANCGAPELPDGKPHRMCSRCKMTFYCSAECQKTHWKTGGHKQHCVAREDRRVKKGSSVASGGGGCEGGGSGAAAAAEGPECAICFEPLSQSPSQTLPCTHEYHIDCVGRLRSFGISQACPICRAELPPGPEKVYEDAIRRWFVLHRRYGQGDGKPWRKITRDDDRRDRDEVMRIMHEAAEQGHAGAQSSLGIMYRDGQGVAKDEFTAVKWLRKAAEKGIADAQHNLGIMYEHGKGVAKDEFTAVKWYRKAAEQGDADAQCNLGTMYANGQGVAKDESTAAEWYRKAAEQGDADAQCNLGIMYEKGKGVAKDESMAVKWYRKAAEQGNAEAQCSLGVMYAQGKGVPPNLSEALRWFRKAAAQGHEHSAKNIQIIEEAQQRQQQAAAAAASSTSSPQSPPPIPIRTNVQLRGLKAKPELNGQRGVVTGFDASNGRCSVQLEDGRGPYKIKPENLGVVTEKKRTQAKKKEKNQKK